MPLLRPSEFINGIDFEEAFEEAPRGRIPVLATSLAVRPFVRSIVERAFSVPGPACYHNRKFIAARDLRRWGIFNF